MSFAEMASILSRPQYAKIYEQNWQIPSHHKVQQNAKNTPRTSWEVPYPIISVSSLNMIVTPVYKPLCLGNILKSRGCCGVKYLPKTHFTLRCRGNSLLPGTYCSVVKSFLFFFTEKDGSITVSCTDIINFNSPQDFITRKDRLSKQG